MDTFDQYLRGQPFILYMDDRLQPELSHLRKKTYARFHAVALKYNFVIQNMTGSGVPFTSAPPCRLRSTPWRQTTPSYCKLKKTIRISSSSKSFGCRNNSHRLLPLITKSYWMISIATFSLTNTVPPGSIVHDVAQMSPRSKRCIFL